jgi:single-strand DNA-binding protein
MINSVIIMGRLTANPELKTTNNGLSFVKFTVAIDRGNDKNGEKQTDFISVQAWRKTAEFITQWFSKGQMIIVEGSLRTGQYQDKKHTDIIHYTTDVLADKVNFGESKSAREAMQRDSQSQQQGYGNNSQGNTQNSTYGQQSYSSAPQQQNTYSDFSDFEEVINDGDLPF